MIEGQAAQGATYMLETGAMMLGAAIIFVLLFRKLRLGATLGYIVGGVVIGVLVLVWHHWLPLVLAVLFGAATLGAFLVSTTPMGLFGVHEHWTIWEVFVAATVEIVAIVVGLAGLWGYRTHTATVRA